VKEREREREEERERERERPGDGKLIFDAVAPWRARFHFRPPSTTALDEEMLVR
jgi:hypothetical protein